MGTLQLRERQAALSQQVADAEEQLKSAAAIQVCMCVCVCLSMLSCTHLRSGWSISILHTAMPMYVA